MNNILITSIGSKIPLIEAVTKARDKFNKNIKIVGVDSNCDVIGASFVDIFNQIQNIDDLDEKDMIDILNEYNIKYLIPTRDKDVIYFAKIKDILNSNEIFLFSSDFDSVERCYDKLEFYKSNKEFNAIPTSLYLAELSSEQIVVKERFGSGAKNILINISQCQAIEFSKNLNQPIFQPFIAGIEYSVDAYVDTKGVCIATICRSRDTIIDGESKVTTYVKDEVLENIVKEFVEKNKIYFHSVTQVIKNNDKYFIIECNTRFGGASTLSLAMGLDSFYWFLKESIDQSIEFKLNDKCLKQIRIQKDVLFEC